MQKALKERFALVISFVPDLPPRPPRPALPVVTALRLDSPLRGGLLVLGNFDGFHLGHRALLATARKIAGAIPLGVMSCEPHPRQFFGNQQGFRLAGRQSKLRLLEGLDVDYLYQPQFDAEFAALTPDAFAREILSQALGVSTVMAGEDFRFGKGRAGDLPLLTRLGQHYGFRVQPFADQQFAGTRVSSTGVRAAIRAGDLGHAARLLGAPWSVDLIRDDSGGFALDPLLCQPPAGRYILRRPGTDITVTLDGQGSVAPVPGPVPDPGLRCGLWQISGMDDQRASPVCGANISVPVLAPAASWRGQPLPLACENTPPF
nr:adenylyltransferase/cytidyltransferase family protein [Pseudogemmobacter faecipullorum]